MTRFTKGQVVRAHVTAQGMVKDTVYTVDEIEELNTFAGNFVRYGLREFIGGARGHVSDPLIWVGNGHLLLGEVDPTDLADRVTGRIPCTNTSVAGMRDAPVPAHVCVENVDDTGHCVACGEKALRGPVVEVQGLAPSTRDISYEVNPDGTHYRLSKPIRCF
jgi:hypothetical protein